MKTLINFCNFLNLVKTKAPYKRYKMETSSGWDGPMASKIAINQDRVILLWLCCPILWAQFDIAWGTVLLPLVVKLHRSSSDNSRFLIFSSLSIVEHNLFFFATSSFHSSFQTGPWIKGELCICNSSCHSFFSLRLLLPLMLPFQWRRF